MRNLADSARHEAGIPITGLQGLSPAAANAWVDAINWRMARWSSPYDRFTTWRSFGRELGTNILLRADPSLLELDDRSRSQIVDEQLSDLNGTAFLIDDESGKAWWWTLLSEEKYGRHISAPDQRQHERESASSGGRPHVVLADQATMTHEDLHSAIDFVLSLEDFQRLLLQDLSLIAGFDLARAPLRRVMGFFRREITGYGCSQMPHEKATGRDLRVVARAGNLDLTEGLTDAGTSYLHALALGTAPSLAVLTVGVAMDRLLGQRRLADDSQLLELHEDFVGRLDNILELTLKENPEASTLNLEVGSWSTNYVRQDYERMTYVDRAKALLKDFAVQPASGRISLA